MHLGYVIYNKSTIEGIEKAEKVGKHFDVYDKGISYNIESTLGSNCFTWFLPISPNLKNKGYGFDVNEDQYKQYKEYIINKKLLKVNK